MKCMNCGNCKDSSQQTYYCLAKGEFVINENYKPQEKLRLGWKKGTKSYENHRRQSRKEVEV